jgi:hypothetical protein
VKYLVIDAKPPVRSSIALGFKRITFAFVIHLTFPSSSSSDVK